LIHSKICHYLDLRLFHKYWLYVTLTNACLNSIERGCLANVIW
jgi:hypothetical protein